MRDFVKTGCVGVAVALFHLADHFFGPVEAVGEIAVVFLIAGFVSAAFKFMMEEPRGVSAISSGWEAIGVVRRCLGHGSPGAVHGVSNLTLRFGLVALLGCGLGSPGGCLSLAVLAAVIAQSKNSG